MSERSFRERISKYLNVGHEILYLTRSECESLQISRALIKDQMEVALSQYSLGQTQMPPKSHVFPDEQSVYIGMPALIPKESSVGFKWVSAYNNNMKDFKLPSLSAMILVSDYECGWPIAFMDGVHIMETRTPAVAMVCAKYLANLNAETFGMIGLGREGRNHFPVICDTFKNLKKIYIYDVFDAAMDKVIEDFQNQLPVPLVKASLEEIVKESEVLASATFFSTNPKPTIKDEWVPKGQTIIVTDLHSQFHPDTINRADLYVVDSKAQQKGLVEEGYFYGTIPEPTCEIGEIIAGKFQGRTNSDQIIVANPSGMAVDDFAVTNIFIETALERGVGTILPL